MDSEAVKPYILAVVVRMYEKKKPREKWRHEDMFHFVLLWAADGSFAWIRCWMDGYQQKL